MGPLPSPKTSDGALALFWVSPAHSPAWRVAVGPVQVFRWVGLRGRTSLHRAPSRTSNLELLPVHNTASLRSSTVYVSMRGIGYEGIQHGSVTQHLSRMRDLSTTDDSSCSRWQDVSLFDNTKTWSDHLQSQPFL